MSYTEGYNAISRVYDKLNAEIPYAEWADFIERVFEKYAPASPELVLDLACGTGSMTLELAGRGFDMIGIDGSEDMLSVAYERSEGKGILYLMQDMRAFELYGTVQAVTCCLDSVGYLTGEGDLEACFRCVHLYLEPDGIFLFDVNTPYKFDKVYGDESYILEDEIEGSPVYCGWQNSYDKESGICTFSLSLFEERDGVYLRSDEEQHERCYSLEELREALEKTGFEMLFVSGDYSFDSPKENAERWYIAARCIKKEEQNG